MQQVVIRLACNWKRGFSTMKKKHIIGLLSCLLVLFGCSNNNSEQTNENWKEINIEKIDFHDFYLESFDEPNKAYHYEDGMIYVKVENKHGDTTDVFTYDPVERTLMHEHISNLNITVIKTHTLLILNNEFKIADCKLQSVDKEEIFRWSLDEEPLFSVYSKNGDTLPSYTVTYNAYGLLFSSDAGKISENKKLEENKQWETTDGNELRKEFEAGFMYQIITKDSNQ